MALQFCVNSLHGADCNSSDLVVPCWIFIFTFFVHVFSIAPQNALAPARHVSCGRDGVSHDKGAQSSGKRGHLGKLVGHAAIAPAQKGRSIRISSGGALVGMEIMKTLLRKTRMPL